MPYAGKNPATALFFPSNKKLFGRYPQLRSIIGINLQLQIKNVHTGKINQIYLIPYSGSQVCSFVVLLH